MLLTLLMTLLNVGFTFIRKTAISVPGLDINPIAMIIIAQQGENIILGALFVVAAHAVPDLKGGRYLYLALPSMIIVGFLALVIQNVFLLLLTYHLIIGLIAFFLGQMSSRHIIFAMTNLAVNLIIGRIYTAML